MQKIKVTKKQRKAINGLNAMAKYSIKAGKKIVIAGAEYFGSKPLYANVNASKMGAMPLYKKIKVGVPFVKA